MEKSRKKIAIFRALQLGDMLCSIPAFRALRQANPYAHITLIGLPWAKEFVDRFHMYLDDFIPFPGFPGLPEQQYNTKDILSFINTLQKQKFDLIIQMHGNGSVINPLMYLCGAKYVAGFYRKEDYYPDKNTFTEYPSHLSEVERNLSLMKFLGARVKDTHLEFPFLSFEREKLFSHPLFQEIRNKPYICLHPGARDPQRRWNPVYFAYVADRLSQKGFPIVITGTKKELSLSKTLVSLMKQPAINFTGNTDIGTFAALVQHSRLLISNCTGASHIADALSVPSITIYLSSDPKQWAPSDTTLHKQIAGKYTKNPLFALTMSLNLLSKKSSPVTIDKRSFV